MRLPSNTNLAVLSGVALRGTFVSIRVLQQVLHVTIKQDSTPMGLFPGDLLLGQHAALGLLLDLA